MIVGDFNIDWLDANDNERKQFYTLLETFGLVQRIGLHMYENDRLLDYIITRDSNNSASEFTVSDNIYIYIYIYIYIWHWRHRPNPARMPYVYIYIYIYTN